MVQRTLSTNATIHSYLLPTSTDDIGYK